LGVTIPPAIADATAAGGIVDEIDAALEAVNGNRATLGGFQNQMENQLNYLAVANENLMSADAAIRNTDIAAETSNLARLQIQQQAAVAAAAQANVMPSLLLQLL